MSVWALVPVKDFGRGKSRLRPTLSDEERASFARSLFEHVLDALGKSRVIDGILVATDSDEVAKVAYARGAEVRSDAPGATTLSQIVDGGLAQLAARGATTALVLMADLPRVQPEDVRALVAQEGDVVLVRADDGRHTNALILRPPDCIATAFGTADSFQTHLDRAVGLRAALVVSPRISFDVDAPADHARLTSA